MMEMFLLTMIFVAFVAGEIIDYKRMNELEDRISRLERKTIWK